MQNRSLQSIAVNADRARRVVKMFVAAMAESLIFGRLFLQKRAAFRAQSFRARKNQRPLPTIRARHAVRRTFDAVAATQTRLRISDGEHRIQYLLKHIISAKFVSAKIIIDCDFDELKNFRKSAFVFYRCILSTGQK